MYSLIISVNENNVHAVCILNILCMHAGEQETLVTKPGTIKNVVKHRDNFDQVNKMLNLIGHYSVNLLKKQLHSIEILRMTKHFDKCMYPRFNDIFVYN